MANTILNTCETIVIIVISLNLRFLFKSEAGMIYDALKTIEILSILNTSSNIGIPKYLLIHGEQINKIPNKIIENTKLAVKTVEQSILFSSFFCTKAEPNPPSIKTSAILVKINKRPIQP